MVFPGMNPRSAAGNKVAAAIIHAHAEKEVEATREAAAKVNVVEGVLESLKYGTWKTVAVVRGLEECKQRMVLQWQTTGVVSVLLASLLMPVVLDSPFGSNDIEEAHQPEIRAFNLLTVISLVLNLASILQAYLLVIEIDQVVTEVDFAEFIDRFQHFDEVLKTMFTLSCLALFGCVLMGVWIRCNATDLMSEFYGVLAFCAVTAIVVAYSATVMDMFTKARLSAVRAKHKAAEVDLVAATAKSVVARQVLGGAAKAATGLPVPPMVAADGPAGEIVTAPDLGVLIPSTDVGAAAAAARETRGFAMQQ